jgi:hypothetical protein
MAQKVASLLLTQSQYHTRRLESPAGLSGSSSLSSLSAEQSQPALFCRTDRITFVESILGGKAHLQFEKNFCSTADSLLGEGGAHLILLPLFLCT